MSKLSKEEMEALVKHYGDSESSGEYDSTVVGPNGETIGEIRKALAAPTKAKKK